MDDAVGEAGKIDGVKPVRGNRTHLDAVGPVAENRRRGGVRVQSCNGERHRSRFHGIDKMVGGIIDAERCRGIGVRGGVEHDIVAGHIGLIARAVGYRERGMDDAVGEAGKIDGVKPISGNRTHLDAVGPVGENRRCGGVGIQSCNRERHRSCFRGIDDMIGGVVDTERCRRIGVGRGVEHHIVARHIGLIAGAIGNREPGMNDAVGEAGKIDGVKPIRGNRTHLDAVGPVGENRRRGGVSVQSRNGERHRSRFRGIDEMIGGVGDG